MKVHQFIGDFYGFKTKNQEEKIQMFFEALVYKVPRRDITKDVQHNKILIVISVAR